MDWKRPVLEVLLKLYKDHPILYDMRHPNYYNKTQRQKVLNSFVEFLEDSRPGTTVADILKKIQVLRTQFGQEMTKAKKSQGKAVQYVPTVWWYPYLTFLRNHIKQRTDEDINVSITTQQSDGEYEQANTDDGYDVETDSHSEIVYEIQSTPRIKGAKTSVSRKSGASSGSTLKEEIIYEINGNTLVQKRPSEDVSTPSAEKQPRLDHSANEVFEMSVESDRSRSIGQFVASQMASIKDDYLFYSTQMEVLNVINKAQLQQLQMERSTTSN